MTSETLLYQARLRLNRLGTGVGLDLPPAVFVSLYNSAQTNWFKEALARAADSVQREDFSELLIPDYRLLPDSQQERAYQFSLPSDCYQLTDVFVRAHKESCQRSFSARLEAPQTLATLWNNPLTAPSFDWEETLYHRTRRQLAVYYTDFRIDSLLISYYRSPGPIDLPGYIHLDGRPSAAVDSELDEFFQEAILDRMIASLAA